MQSIASAVGIPADQLALVGGLLFSVLLSLLMKNIRNPTLKIWLNIVFGSLMQWVLYKQQIIYNWIQTVVIYFICVLAPRKKLGRYVIIESGLYLLVIQFKRYLSSVTTNVDITAILMISTTKFITFAYCYQDGAYKTEELNYPKEQSLRRIVERPSFWVYLGYIQFIPTAMIGPTFEYSDYVNYIYGRKQFANIPNTLGAVVGELKKSAFFVIVYLVLDSIFKVDYLVSSEYSELNFLLQFIYVIVVIIVFKFKYYTAWSLSTIGVKASGIGYQKYYDKQGRQVEDFERIQYANPVALELDPSFKVKIDSWNICVQVFFRRYLYQRILSQKDEESPQAAKLKKKAQELTLLYSTFWHGFYPGYLLSFFHWMLILQVTQELFRVGKNHPKVYKLYCENRVLQYLAIILSNYAFSWIGVFFHLYYLDKIWFFTSIHYYVQFVLIYLSFILIVQFKVFGSGKGRRVKEGTLGAGEGQVEGDSAASLPGVGLSGQSKSNKIEQKMA